MRRHMGQLMMVAFAAAVLLAQSGCGSANADPRPQLKVVEALRDGGAKPGAEEGTAPAEAAETVYGILKGRFVLQGGPPPKKDLAAKLSPGDMAACGQHPIPDESLVVADDGGIANIAIFVRKYAGRPHPSSKQMAQAPVLFDQKECRFISRVMTVQAGQTITVKNSDPVGHNTNISPPNDAAFNPLMSGGSSQTYVFKLPQAVPVPVSCNIHPWMKAYILPRKDPYAAATGSDGSFTIENVPAGQEIELQVWHEKGAGNQNALAAGPIGANGRLKVTVPADSTHDLGTIEVPMSAFRP
jgi:plastocyanin